MHFENTVSIDFDGHFDLRGAAGCWWNALKFKFAEELAVLGHAALTFKDLNDYTRLVVPIGGEGRVFLGWDNGVSGNEHNHDTTGSLDTQGIRSGIEKQHILEPFGLVTIKIGGLDGGTKCNRLIIIDGSVEWLAVEEVREHLLNFWNTGGTADEDDLVDLGLGDVSILKNPLDCGQAFPEILVAKLLELGTSKSDLVILILSKGFTLN